LRVDIVSQRQTGIRVSNTPGAVDDATATTALYLIISTLRQYARGERSLRAGKWKSEVSSATTHDLTGRTLGILGMGGIGGRLAELCHAFPMRVIYHNRSPKPDAPEWAEYVGDMQEFLKQTDVLSVHAPLNQQTVGLVGEKEIRAMKKGSIIVNTARGKVMDEEALIRALEDGHVSDKLKLADGRLTCATSLACFRWPRRFPGRAERQPPAVGIPEHNFAAPLGDGNAGFAKEDGDQGSNKPSGLSHHRPGKGSHRRIQVGQYTCGEGMN
jgi:hypothetical protein